MEKTIKEAINQWSCAIGIHYWSIWYDIEDEMDAYGHNHQWKQCLDCGIKRKRWFGNN